MIRTLILWLVVAIMVVIAIPVLLISAPFLMFRDRPARNDLSGDDRE
jgi:hypothetical protein